MKTSHAILATLLTTLISACGGTNSSRQDTVQTGTTHNSAQALAAMTWQLTHLKALGQASSTHLNAGDAANRYKIVIKNNRLGISGGCNLMGGSVTLSKPNQISVGPMMGTKRACMGSLMRSDAELSDYLSQVSHYLVKGNTLVLSSPNGQQLTFKGMLTPEAKYGAKGIRKFIEIRHSTQGQHWREAKYDSNWVRIQDNTAWQTNLPKIQGFKSEKGMQYIVRLHEYTEPKTQRKVWIKDMVTMSGTLK